VPAIHCEMMFSTFDSLINIHNQDIIAKLRQYGNTYISSNEMRDEIFFDYIKNNTLLKKVQEKFRSKQYRLDWIHNHKYYVGPIEIKLDSSSNELFESPNFESNQDKTDSRVPISTSILINNEIIDVNNLSVVNLKNELKKRNLTTSGIKADLISRLKPVICFFYSVRDQGHLKGL